MVVVISDLFEDAGKLIEAMHHLRHKRHEVILLQVMADDELDFPFRKWSLFENLEQSADKIRLDPALMRANYLAALGRHQQALKDGLAKLHVSHLLLNTSRPFDEALATYLAQRRGGSKGRNAECGMMNAESNCVIATRPAALLDFDSSFCIHHSAFLARR
jgi:hypothetical protein